MTKTNMNMLRAALFAGALSVSMAATTSAQPPVVVSGGLVNVTVVDVIDDIEVTVQDINVTVAAALQLAANVCDVSVNALAQQLKGGSASCDTAIEDGTRIVTISP